MTRQTTLSLFAALTLCAACGGGPAADDSAEAEPVTETSGDEGYDEPEETSSTPPPPTSGPGQIHVVNVVRNEEVGGNVQVVDAAGNVVAEGAAGGIFNVDSGTYSLIGEITDDSIIVDTPTHHSDDLVEVPAGGSAEGRIVFPLARVRFNVTRRGRAVARWVLTVTRQGREGGEAIELSPSSEHIPITPGRYDAVLRVGGDEIAVSGLIFQGGATQTVPVAVD